MRVSLAWCCGLLLLSGGLSMSVPAHAQTWLGALAAGTGSLGSQSSYSLIRQSVTDPAGDVYVTGSYGGTVRFGTTTFTAPVNANAAFVAKLSAGGRWLWAVSTTYVNPTGFLLCRSESLALTPAGDVVMAGIFSNDINFGPFLLTGPASPITQAHGFVAKISATGTWLWATPTYPSASASGLNAGGYATGVAVAPTGEVFVTGPFQGTLNFGPTTLTTAGREREAFVAKLTAAGNWQWAVATAGSTGTGGTGSASTSANYIAADGAGNALVTGDFARALTLGSFRLTRLDTVTVGTDAFVAKLSPAGTWQWATRIGRATMFDAYVGALAADPTGNLLLTGASQGTVTFGPLSLTAPPGRTRAFVAKLSPAGNWLWATASNGGASAVSDGGLGLAFDASANILVAGYTRVITPGAPSPAAPLVAKLSPAGVWGWRATGQVSNPREGAAGYSLAFTAGGDVQLSGLFKGAVTLGASSLVSADSNSVFVARLTNGPLAAPALLASAPPLLVWPNPAPGLGAVQVQLNGAAPGALTLDDALGRRVRTQAVAAPARTAWLDLTGLAPGVYFVRSGGAARRLVVE